MLAWGLKREQGENFPWGGGTGTNLSSLAGNLSWREKIKLDSGERKGDRI